LPNHLPCPSNSRWLVSLLRCRDGSLYCGITNDLPSNWERVLLAGHLDSPVARSPWPVPSSEPQKSESVAL
jgi:hypothetical protein